MITSTKNAAVKQINQLMKSKKARYEQGLFVVEGWKMLEETLAQAEGAEIDRVYVSQDLQEEAVRKLKGYPFECVSAHVLAAMTDTKTPQGVVAVVKTWQTELSSLIKNTTEHAAPLLILENIQDPGNLGTMIRTAEGAGAAGIIASSDTADLYSPKVVRSTMGSLYRVPFVYVESLEQTIMLLKKEKILCMAAYLKGESVYKTAGLQGPCAFMIGNEGNGLTKQTSELADTLITIPMCGRLESLNASVSAAILLYESLRQRS